MAAHDYVAPAPAHKMGWGKTPCLLMVDVCTAYWNDGSPNDLRSNPAACDVPDSMRRVVAAARKGKVPVVWTRVVFNTPDMSDAGVFYLKHPHLSIWQVGDTRGYDQWMPELEPAKEDLVISKQYPSAFFGTTLSTTLRQMGVDTVVVCGVSTSGCVRATTLDAMMHGFRPMVCAAACGDKSGAVHNANLYDLHKKYSDVVTEAETLEKLEKGWATP